MAKNKNKLIVVVPEFNEGQRAVGTIKNILMNSDCEKIIVVDDGSINDSWKILSNNFKNNSRVIIVRHILNLGKGAAMKTGVKLAWKLGANSVIFLDADGQHNPVHLKEFEKSLKKFGLVFGYRELNGEMPFVRRWGNIIAKWIVKNLFNVKRKEFLCGFLGFRKDIYPKIEWSSRRYEVEMEIAVRVGKNNLQFSEVKVDTIYIDKYKGVSMIDAVKMLLKVPYFYLKK